MGRLEGKERGVEDFEACVRALQKETGIGAAHTCLFGRSAGGYLMGTTVLRNPGGKLAKYVYTEAPYVDVLQTSSNVKLPLTVFEYLEFGDPAHSISDFEMLLRLSPIGGTGPNGAPGVFVLCRAGLNDRQVYAYESVKWMDVLRGTKRSASLNAKHKDQKKILFLTKGVGHNVHGKLLHIERAEDFLILYKTMNL
jgi:oligopeptidase B